MKAFEESSICYLCLCTQWKGHYIFLIFFLKFAHVNLLLIAHKGFATSSLCLFHLLFEFAYIIVVKAHKGMQNGFFASSSLYISFFLLEFASIIVANTSQRNQMEHLHHSIFLISCLNLICLCKLLLIIQKGTQNGFTIS